MSRGLGAILVVAAFAGGMVAGRSLPGRPDWPASQLAPLRLEDRAGGGPRLTGRPVSAPRSAGPAAEAAAPPAGGAATSVEADPGASETTPRARPALDLDAAIAAIATEDGDDAEAAAAVERLRRDPAALAEAIARFRAETDPARLAALAALLGQVRTPAVEALAIDLARAGGAEHRVAALEILDTFETPAAIPVAAEILAADADPALLRAALYALPEPAGVSTDVAAAVDRDLARLARAAPDAETRRRAVERLGAWATSPQDEVTIIDALARDPDAIVRAAAAFALEGRRGGGAAGIRALAEVLARRDEDRDVRENAWQALRRAGPLPPEARAAYEAYALEREGETR